MSSKSIPQPTEMSEEMRRATTVSSPSLAREVLDEYGFVVLEGLLSQSEAEEGISLTWDYLESLGTGIVREDYATHDNTKWPPTFSTGILDNPDLQAGQSRVAWWGRKKCKRAFSALYGTEDLVTSFDTIGVYRGSVTTSKDPWYHTDASPQKHGADYSTQGVLNLIDTTREGGGGLVVLPKSHKLLFPHLVGSKDWIPLWDDKDFWEKYESELEKCPDLLPTRVGAPAGSLILFYSSTVHCNTPHLKVRGKEGRVGSLARAVLYICMAPRERVTDSDWLEKRRKCVDDGVTTSHWPNRIEKKRRPRFPLKRPLHTSEMRSKGTVLTYDDLDEEMKSLL